MLHMKVRSYIIFLDWLHFKFLAQEINTLNANNSWFISVIRNIFLRKREIKRIAQETLHWFYCRRKCSNVLCYHYLLFEYIVVLKIIFIKMDKKIACFTNLIYNFFLEIFLINGIIETVKNEKLHISYKS